jgi:small membrane protein
MTIKLLLAIPLILFFMYIMALPKYQLLGKVFILVFVAILLLFALNPDLSTVIANYFGVGRGADFLFYISHLVLFFIAFRFYLRNRNLEARLNRLVQQLALKDAVDHDRSGTP